MEFTQISVDVQTRENIRKQADAHDRPMSQFLRFVFRPRRASCGLCGAAK